MPLPFPQRIFSRVTDITPALLAGLGVRGILLDIDGTIAPTHTPLPPQEVRDWLDTLKQAGAGSPLAVARGQAEKGRL